MKQQLKLKSANGSSNPTRAEVLNPSLRDDIDNVIPNNNSVTPISSPSTGIKRVLKEKLNNSVQQSSVTNSEIQENTNRLQSANQHFDNGTTLREGNVSGNSEVLDENIYDQSPDLSDTESIESMSSIESTEYWSSDSSNQIPFSDLINIYRGEGIIDRRLLSNHLDFWVDRRVIEESRSQILDRLVDDVSDLSQPSLTLSDIADSALDDLIDAMLWDSSVDTLVDTVIIERISENLIEDAINQQQSDPALFRYIVDNLLPNSLAETINYDLNTISLIITGFGIVYLVISRNSGWFVVQGLRLKLIIDIIRGKPSIMNILRGIKTLRQFVAFFSKVLMYTTKDIMHGLGMDENPFKD